MDDETKRLARESANSSKARRKADLWIEQEGLCYWCKKPTLLPFMQGYWRKTGAISGKAATIDHLYSRHHEKRFARNVGPRLVMACSTCNGARSKDECLRHNGVNRRDKNYLWFKGRKEQPPPPWEAYIPEKFKDKQ